MITGTLARSSEEPGRSADSSAADRRVLQEKI
jgi:hypothetical protein